MIPTTAFYQALLGGALFCTVLAIAGGLLTNLSPWYYALKQPSWKPPDWAFGPVWTTIFICLSFAIAYAWDACDTTQRTYIVWAVLANGILNIAWSMIFFNFQKPSYALLELVIFWLSVVVLIYVLGGASRISLYLLLPYIAWVTTAGVLNYQIVRMNPQ